MTTELLDVITSKDPTWHYAYHFVRRHFDVPSHLVRLFRAGWMGEATTRDYVKILGFSRLNPGCLIQAAELSGSVTMKGRGAVERSIAFLGIRFSAVVLGIQLFTSHYLKKKPPLGWRSFLQEVMSDIEIGYRFGTYTPTIGSEGGALVGFSRNTGLGLSMIANPEGYKKYMAMRRQKSKITGQDEVEAFGCELYQLSTLIIQQMGFGTDFAFGLALSSGRLNEQELTLTEQANCWSAAQQWVYALKHGHNYPRELRHREAFPDLKPPAAGGVRNKKLESLYTEVAKIKSTPTNWFWHLPVPDYDKTRDMFKLP